MKKFFFMMIATLLVCAITVKSQNTTTGTNVLLSYTAVKEWKDIDASTQKMLLGEVHKNAFNAKVTLAGDSIIQVVMIKNVPNSKTTSKTGIWIQMLDGGKVVNRWFNGDKLPTITRSANGKLNADGGNGDDDRYED